MLIGWKGDGALLPRRLGRLPLPDEQVGPGLFGPREYGALVVLGRGQAVLPALTPTSGAPRARAV